MQGIEYSPIRRYKFDGYWQQNVCLPLCNPKCLICSKHLLSKIWTEKEMLLLKVQS